MSVLLQMAMFPTDKSESKSEQVSQVIKVIKQSGFPYKLTAMSTVIETNKMSEALGIVQKCYEKLEEFVITSYSIHYTKLYDITFLHNS